MAKQAKFLVATDSRLPLTVALAHAFASNQISPDLLATRKKELVDLVSEAAKTFGFQSRTTLTGAFEMATGLLSLALANRTKGEALPDQWAGHLVTQSWKSLVKESISLVRAVKEQDDAYDYLFENDKDPRMLRDHLRAFVHSRDAHQQWTGYKAFLHYRNERQQNQRVDTLIRSLIKTLVKRPLFWMKDPIEGPTCADEALNTLLFRVATGLGFAQKDIVLSEKEFRHVRTQYDDSPGQWIKAGEQRFEALLSSIPEGLHTAIDQKWFSKRLAKGPPKVRKWESEMLPGITGFYYYQTYL
ncbi:MAG TPA: hypothetical protein VGC39_03165 [Candidatus Methylacidiphilales bacterium]